MHQSHTFLCCWGGGQVFWQSSTIILCVWKYSVKTTFWETDHDRGNVGGDGLEVLEGGGPGDHQDVGDEKEDAQQDAEGSAHPGQEDVLLVEDRTEGLGLLASCKETLKLTIST